MSYDGGEKLAPGSGPLTYAVLTAEARRRATLPRPKAHGRREADVQRVPWWRVRTLRGISGLSILAPAVICAVLVLVIYALVGDSSLAPQALFVLVVAVGLALYGGYRLRSGGGATASALARAACAPGPVSKRYALLYDPPWGGIACWCCSRQAGATTSGPRRYWNSGLCRCLSPGSRGNAGFRLTCPWSPSATSKSVAGRTSLRWASRGSTGARTGRSIPTAPTT